MKDSLTVTASKDQETLQELEVAIVHYWFTNWRSGEKVVKSLLKLFPKADIYTLFFDESSCGKYLLGHHVTSSILDTPKIRKKKHHLFPLFPVAVNSLKLSKKYDLILSSEAGPAKGIPRGKFNQTTPHLCYVHSPMRHCYGFEDEYVLGIPALFRPPARARLRWLRKWDQKTVSNVDLFVANSKNVQKRIKYYFHRPSQVCYPPVDLALLQRPIHPNGKDYYLSFGALSPYKNIELLVDCFNKNGKPLVIIGDGVDAKRLRKKAKPNIHFKGYLEDWELEQWFLNTKAFLFPGEEDFGMIPMNMMARGIPVIALKKGGAKTMVIENLDSPDKASGMLFDTATPASLQDALDRFEKYEDFFDPIWIQSHASNFGEDIFLRKMSKIILELLKTPISPLK